MENWKIYAGILIACFSLVIVIISISNLSYEALPELNVKLGLGLIGTVLILISPVYFFEKWQEGLFRVLVICFIMLICGFGFIVAWLWS